MAVKTKVQAQNQTSKERLWDELDQAYSEKKAESDRAYDQNYSEAGRQTLSKGMQRSSFGAQTQANVLKQKAEARDKIGSEQMAAYQKGLNELEQREADERYRNAQLALQEKQLQIQKEANEANIAFEREKLEWQAGQNKLNREQETTERLGAEEFTAGQNELNRASSKEELGMQIASSESEGQKNREANAALQETSLAATASENEKNREHEEKMQILQNTFTSGENEKNREAQQLLQEMSQAWQSGENDKAREAAEKLQLLTQDWQSGENEKDRDVKLILQQMINDLTVSENEKNRVLEKELTEEKLAAEKEQFYASLGQTKDLTEQQLELEKQKLQVQEEEWQAEFDYNAKTDAEKLAFNYITLAAEQGGDVSDTMLEQAGLSRQDYNAMKKQAASSGATTNTKETPAWQDAGFLSEADYENAKKKNINSTQYYDQYLSGGAKKSDIYNLGVTAGRTTAQAETIQNNIYNTLTKGFSDLFKKK